MIIYMSNTTCITERTITLLIHKPAMNSFVNHGEQFNIKYLPQMLARDQFAA